MNARLATSVWVNALVRRASAEGVYATVARRGDPIAGAVILIERRRDGRLTAWSRVTGIADAWTRALEADEEQPIQDYLDRQARYDPDLWVVELVTQEIQPFIAEPSSAV